ncbi:MAG TPA: multicopper oxidase domain-containing protein, partial [Flavobacteriales bacterium]|nr:multicopper oxidase domain-containing protein [Flavobacteriales bacterium]
VDAGEEVRVIMRFEELSYGWPYMYHCHNLMHEDNMMMLQYIVVDPNTNVSEGSATSGLRIFPSPTQGTLVYQAPFAVEEIILADALGRFVRREHGSRQASGTFDMSALPSGAYLLFLRSEDDQVHQLVVRE